MVEPLPELRPSAPTVQQSPSLERPLVVASNRLPFSFAHTDRGIEPKRASGGLVSALEPMLKQSGGTWVGWPGTDAIDIELPRESDYVIRPVSIASAELAGYYHGFSNRTLWPLFHSMTGRSHFDGDDYAAYEAVNDRFAEAIGEVAGGAGLVWVHDFHLMLAPRVLRSGLDPEVPLAFFLHVPFPPYDIFRLLPWDRELLRSLLACDLIGFHTHGYARNFLDCAERLLGARVHRQSLTVEYGDRTTRIGVYPIGVEFGLYERLARETLESDGQENERIVLGVDRLDYTKGIAHRLRAFARLLEDYPEHRERVTLFQLAVPSRAEVVEYQELKREIDELVGSINGRFATADWSPIRYLFRSFDPPRVAALYRDADVALVTPLRDGMNLVAKEFVACQVNDPGVLVLSRLAGAAETMREALLVNPYDMVGMAEALHRALTMDEDERASRVAALRRRERRDDLSAWARRFTSEAAAARADVRPMSDAEFEEWLGGFLKRYRIALFLDYDGTLTPLAEHPDKATLSPRARSALRACIAHPSIDVAVISGRSLASVRTAVNEPSVVYAGNHGLEIEGLPSGRFEHEDLIHYRSRAEGLASDLDRIAADGAWTERKGPTLTFHYRQVPPGERASLITEAHETIRKAGYQSRDAHDAVEARPPIGWDKGRAVLFVLRSLYGPAWSEQVRPVYVGDDRTDEDAFRFLAGLSATFRVGRADTPTAATRRLPSVDAVLSLLEWLGRRDRPLGNLAADR